jgi:hypothetical protein
MSIALSRKVDGFDCDDEKSLTYQLVFGMMIKQSNFSFTI